ncbi:hypothetical protein [Bradyrhizobium elkanii]|uniref:hypothetical protein n=1 Tax=Bradyrhizobium elkanii TaxID=29448 RepID=UPI0004B3E0C9|nr:hypothetical protein [Bradyrhizobium elkanii]WLA79610.1 hypothetical protein QNJ99_29965 [Bradyrhizobium elkanii]
MRVAHLSEIPAADPLDRHAAVLADIKKIQDDLIETRDANAQLHADLHREQDRVALLVEDRDRWRQEALVFRTRLIELATAMANIGLLTRAAEGVVLTELTGTEKATGEAVGKLDEAFAKGNATAATAVA